MYGADMECRNPLSSTMEEFWTGHFNKSQRKDVVKYLIFIRTNVHIGLPGRLPSSETFKNPNLLMEMGSSKHLITIMGQTTVQHTIWSNQLFLCDFYRFLAISGKGSAQEHRTTQRD